VRHADEASRRLKTRCFDQADEPTILAAEPGNDRGRNLPGPWRSGLRGFQHLYGARELALFRVGHVDFDQELRHGLIVARRSVSGYREEHRAGT
jgi:hypothetical protein